MQKVATAHKLTAASPLSRKQFPLSLALSVFLLAALWFGLCRELSGEWSVNEQYNFGWFVPFFALYLFWLRWQDRPQVSGQWSLFALFAPAGKQAWGLLLTGGSNEQWLGKPDASIQAAIKSNED